MGRELPVIAIKGNGSKQSPIRSNERILMNMCKSKIVYVCRPHLKERSGFSTSLTSATITTNRLTDKNKQMLHMQ